MPLNRLKFPNLKKEVVKFIKIAHLEGRIEVTDGLRLGSPPSGLLSLDQIFMSGLLL
jgi:hypothetical protein